MAPQRLQVLLLKPLQRDLPGEMVQLVLKCLLPKREDLSSVSSDHIKSQECWCSLEILTSQRNKQVDSQGLLQASLANL